MTGLTVVSLDRRALKTLGGSCRPRSIERARRPRLGRSDLDDDGEDHRAAAELLVNELGEVVVQVLLDQVDLVDVVVGRPVQGVLDRFADQAAEGVIVLAEFVYNKLRRRPMILPVVVEI